MDDFVPLLKQAHGIVHRRLPLALHALNTMFSFLVSDFKNVVAKASSGPFLDPSQNAKEMASTLSHMCAHVHYLSAQLEQLSRISQNLTGENWFPGLIAQILSFERVQMKQMSSY